jgi:hypothetical protein
VTLPELLAELRALAAQEAPQRAAVDRAFAAAAVIMKHQPRDAPIILRKALPLVMHAQTHVQRGAAEGVLKLLDLAAALPDDVIDDAMPVLAQLLDFSIGKWSFSQSTYRFARFPRLRQRILDAALEMAVAERNHTDPSVAVMALHDVIGGLQKCNAFDAPQVTEAFARYALGQTNAAVQRAVVAYLLGPAPHVVARVLDVNPELFPSIEDITIYRSEQYHHLVDPGPHEARVAGLAQLPVANLELFLLDDNAHPGRRMAAALAVPHLVDQAARARFLPVLRRMLDDTTSKHVGVVEGQALQPETFTLRHVVLPALTQALRDSRDPALALEALCVAVTFNVAPTKLVDLARCCDRTPAAAWLTTVVGNEPEAASTFAPDAAENVRWNAFAVLCAIADDVTPAAAALARDIASATPERRRLVNGLHTTFTDIVEASGPDRFAPLWGVFPASMGLSESPPLLRLAGYFALKNGKHAAALRETLEEAKRVLVQSAKTDKPLAEALLIRPP